MNIYHIPYTYLIGWSAQNKWYYGVQYGKNANPINLWTTYFTSSKTVAKFRQLYGDPDIIQVRKCFLDKESAVLWEDRVLRRINNKQIFINLRFGTFKGIIHTEEMKAKISSSLKLKFEMHPELKPTPPHRKGHGRPKGMPHSDETKQKLSDAAKGKLRPKSDEHKQKLSEAAKGKPKSEEHKRRISESLKKFKNPA